MPKPTDSNNTAAVQTAPEATGEAPAITPERYAELVAKANREADFIEEMLSASMLFAVIKDSSLGAASAKIYLDRLKKRASKTEDPIEALVIEQILLVHFRLGKLHGQAAAAVTPEGIKIINAASARLSGEFRRLVLALQTYRCPATGKSVAFIKQQNVANSQDVRFEQRSHSKKESLSARSKLEDAEPYGGRFAEQDQKSGKGRRRKDAASVDA